MTVHVRTAIIGGGMLGIGTLYHLAEEGWTDTVLIEKGELTSGSTWHAAGLCAHFVGSPAVARIHAYGIGLYRELQRRRPGGIGWHECGSLRLALTEEEVDWFRRFAGQARHLGFEAHLVGPQEIRELHPLLETFEVKLGFWTPTDGHVDPSSAANALAEAAREKGARILRRTRVTGIAQRSSGEWEVTTEKGTIVCEHLVNAAGSYARQLAAWNGLDLPIVDMLHQYVVTETVPALAGLERELPVVRDPWCHAYLRQERQGLLVGPYEREGARPVFEEGAPWSFEMELFPPELDRLMPWLERAAKRLPSFGEAGIRRAVSGAIGHTPDGNFLMGPAPGLRNYWLATGSSIGIVQGPGVGRHLAQMMVHGRAEISTLEFDPRRFGRWADADYVRAKAIDEYQHMYVCPLPGEQREAGRPVRRSPLHAALVARGGVHMEAAGWERPQWFAPAGVTERHGFRHTNAFPHVAEECRAVREAVGVMDFTSFAKFTVSGPDAAAFLDRLVANRLPKREGGIVLAHFLDRNGRIQGEVTVTRLAADRFYLCAAAAAELRDLDHLRCSRRPGERVEIANRTETVGLLVVAGPKSRELLQPLTATSLTSDRFPWLTGREIVLAGIPLTALRVNYVGELGWELHCPMERLHELYDAVMEAGSDHGARDFGAYAVNSLRMEKAYRGFGSELTHEVDMIEAAMERFLALEKGEFIGREASLRAREKGPRIRLVHLEIAPGDADVLGDEPVFAGERIVGVTTSGAFGHVTGKSLAFAYVDPGLATPGTALAVEILGETRPARVLAEPVWDPANRRLRA